MIHRGIETEVVRRHGDAGEPRRRVEALRRLSDMARDHGPDFRMRVVGARVLVRLDGRIVDLRQRPAQLHDFVGPVGEHLHLGQGEEVDVGDRRHAPPAHRLDHVLERLRGVGVEAVVPRSRHVECVSGVPHEGVLPGILASVGEIVEQALRHRLDVPAVFVVPAQVLVERLVLVAVAEAPARQIGGRLDLQGGESGVLDFVDAERREGRGEPVDHRPGLEQILRQTGMEEIACRLHRAGQRVFLAALDAAAQAVAVIGARALRVEEEAHRARLVVGPDHLQHDRPPVAVFLGEGDFEGEAVHRTSPGFQVSSDGRVDELDASGHEQVVRGQVLLEDHLSQLDVLVARGQRRPGGVGLERERTLDSRSRLAALQRAGHAIVADGKPGEGDAKRNRSVDGHVKRLFSHDVVVGVGHLDQKIERASLDRAIRRDGMHVVPPRRDLDFDGLLGIRENVASGQQHVHRHEAAEFVVDFAVVQRALVELHLVEGGVGKSIAHAESDHEPRGRFRIQVGQDLPVETERLRVGLSVEEELAPAAVAPDHRDVVPVAAEPFRARLVLDLLAAKVARSSEQAGDPPRHSDGEPLASLLVDGGQHGIMRNVPRVTPIPVALHPEHEGAVIGDEARNVVFQLRTELGALLRAADPGRAPGDAVVRLDVLGFQRRAGASGRPGVEAAVEGQCEGRIRIRRDRLGLGQELPRQILDFDVVVVAVQRHPPDRQQIAEQHAARSPGDVDFRHFRLHIEFDGHPFRIG